MIKTTGNSDSEKRHSAFGKCQLVCEIVGAFTRKLPLVCEFDIIAGLEHALNTPSQFGEIFILRGSRKITFCNFCFLAKLKFWSRNYDI
jgi:hypothetical protein